MTIELISVDDMSNDIHDEEEEIKKRSEQLKLSIKRISNELLIGPEMGVYQLKSDDIQI